LNVEPLRPDPGRFLPVQAIHQLLIRPVEDFAAALLARLRAVPAHLQGATAVVRVAPARVPPLWVASAITAARAGARFLQDLPAHPKIVAHAQRLADLPAALPAAQQALVAYADFLQQEIGPQARGDFACGTEHFESLLRRRHFLPVSSMDLRALGERLFQHTQEEMLVACREMGAPDMATLLRRINADHPSADQLLQHYRDAMHAAHAFVRDRDLVSLPLPTRVDVVETPEFLRHQIPFAAYSEPSPQDAEQQGHYYVTPPVDAEQLAEHNHAGIAHTCVHEAWPGHHLQFVVANRTPVARSLPRLLNPSSTLYEGWALYCEQLMHEQGFLARPEARFLLLKDRLWRALRILIDVDLHTRGLTLEAAADLMVRHLGFNRDLALADLTWYTRAPTVPMSYATGWSIINVLRTRLRRDTPDFDLKQFHDRLLSQGSIGLPRVVRRVFGDAAWDAVAQELFPGGGHATA
jgi:uncharacterized protein (DUF885 family)